MSNEKSNEKVKFTVARQSFAEMLGTVGRGVRSTWTGSAIATCALLVVEGDEARLTGTDIETTFIGRVSAEVESGGSIALPVKVAESLVKSFTSDMIEFEIDLETHTAFLTSGFDTAQIKGKDAEDFPQRPEVSNFEVAKIGADTLREALARVGFSAATEDTRPVLQTVKVEIEEDRFVFVSADGFRLSIYEGDLAESFDGRIDALVPARSFRELGRLLGGYSDNVELCMSTKKAALMTRIGEVELFIQLAQGTFPQYRQLIPDGGDTMVNIKRERFATAIAAARSFDNDAQPIRLYVNKGESGESDEVVLIAYGGELGEYEGRIEARVEGVEGRIAFNANFLAQAVAATEDDVNLTFKLPSEPCLFTYGESHDAELGYEHVLMPMFVQWADEEAPKGASSSSEEADGEEPDDDE